MYTILTYTSRYIYRDKYSDLVLDVGLKYGTEVTYNIIALRYISRLRLFYNNNSNIFYIGFQTSVYLNIIYALLFLD